MNFLRQLPLAIVLFLNLDSFSQQIKFDRIVPPTGGFSGFVGGITQDKYGYMWLATKAGLFRYDGYKFKIYTNNPSDSNSLSNNYLEKVYADRKGQIWIATWISGLDRLDPGTGKFRHFKHDPHDPGSLSNDTVRALLEDRDGVLWIGTSGGLDEYDPTTEKFRHYSYKANDPGTLSCNRVRIVYEDRSGIIWVGTGSAWDREGGETDEGGLNRFDKRTGRFTRYLSDPKDPHSLINNKVNAIFEDSRGIFWVGTAGDGLHTMDRAMGKFERHPYDPAHPGKLSRPPLKKDAVDYITFINEDAQHNIWIGTLSNGINQYDPRKDTVTHYGGFDNTSNFNGYSGWCFYNSADGNLWIGTYEGGIFHADPNRREIDHLPTAGAVWAFNENSDGFWIASTDGLIFKSAKKGRSYKFGHQDNDRESLSNSSLRSLFRDKEGILWLGTVNGLCRFNSHTNNFTTYLNDPHDGSSIASGPVLVMIDEGKDSLWVGTGNGLDLMSKRTGKFIHFKNNAPDHKAADANFVVALSKEGSGKLWVAYVNNNGLDLLDRATGRFQQFLKGRNVSSLVRDSSGALWVGTDTGLYVTKDYVRGFKKFAATAGPIDISGVLSMQDDDQHKIWVSCNSGILRIDPFTGTITVETNDINAGLVTPISGYKGLDGKIYFGAYSGYYVFHADKTIFNSTPPQIVITDFSVGGRSVSPGPHSVLTTPIEITREILLGHNQNSFSFEFAGIHFSDPASNQHLYMLENYDQTWREARGNRVASYFNVPAGHYIFHVKASSNGVWAEKSVRVVISPPWWETWQFRILSVIAMVIVIYSIIKERSRKLKAENILLEQKVNERTQQLQQSINDLKSTQAQLVQSEKMASLGELTAGIAHEIQNPLNFINNFSEVNSELVDEMRSELVAGNTQSAIEIADDIKDNEQKINHHGKRADAIVKSMLQHSRTSSGQKEPTDINALADEYLRLAYHGLRAKDKSFNAKFETHFDYSIGKINIVPQDIGRVLLNLINNAFYAVNEKQKKQLPGYEPTVSVETKGATVQVEIKVKDNGSGIPQKAMEKIFQPFFTTKPTGEGTGLGLSLAYDIVKAHGGEIKVKTKEAEGSEFTIQLPITSHITEIQ